jgi:hypothetical protein
VQHNQKLRKLRQKKAEFVRIGQLLGKSYCCYKSGRLHHPYKNEIGVVKRMNQMTLNYEEFIGNLRQKLYQIIPPEVEMRMHQVKKNNALQLDGLVLYSGELTASPNFYMQEYYKRYRRGENVGTLAQEIYGTWSEMRGSFVMESSDMSFETCRDFVFYRLVNRERNQDLLEEIPFIPVFDLAVIFYYLVKSEEDGIQSIRISRQIMEMWETDAESLLEAAAANTPRLFPASYKPLVDVMERFEIALPPVTMWYDKDTQPYMLSNEKGINGASVWLYEGQLEQIADFHDSNFYILPSSIHELLIMPQRGKDEKKLENCLLEMVHQVNRDCVTREEYLSDNIYLYDREKKAIKIIGRN